MFSDSVICLEVEVVSNCADMTSALGADFTSTKSIGSSAETVIV